MALLLVGACGPDETVEPSALQYDNYGPIILRPDTATVGRPVTISVTTFGYPCRHMGSTDVTVSGDGALIEPFDVYVDPGEHGACIRIVSVFRHEASVSFDTPGLKTLVFRGRHVDTYQDLDEPLDLTSWIVIE